VCCKFHSQAWTINCSVYVEVSINWCCRKSDIGKNPELSGYYMLDIGIRQKVNIRPSLVRPSLVIGCWCCCVPCPGMPGKHRSVYWRWQLFASRSGISPSAVQTGRCWGPGKVVGAVVYLQLSAATSGGHLRQTILSTQSSWTNIAARRFSCCAPIVCNSLFCNSLICTHCWQFH